MIPAKIPRETFRIRPSPRSRRFFVVHLAPTLTAMHASMRRAGIIPHGREVGCVIGALGHGRYAQAIGIIWLSMTRFEAGLVAHELAHAAFRACERAGVRVTHWERQPYAATPATDDDYDDYCGQPEERFCQVLEHLTAQFWTEVSRRGLSRSA